MKMACPCRMVCFNLGALQDVGIRAMRGHAWWMTRPSGFVFMG